jgi:hypothetical protein|tara:strand:+ start:542 stop:721 length:180 start_codon:yes stop_codon:yes gene_type:complete
MPIVASSNDGLASDRGIRVYQCFISNCAQQVNLALAKKASLDDGIDQFSDAPKYQRILS